MQSFKLIQVLKVINYDYISLHSWKSLNLFGNCCDAFWWRPWSAISDYRQVRCCWEEQIPKEVKKRKETALSIQQFTVGLDGKLPQVDPSLKNATEKEKSHTGEDVFHSYKILTDDYKFLLFFSYQSWTKSANSRKVAGVPKNSRPTKSFNENVRLAFPFLTFQSLKRDSSVQAQREVIERNGRQEFDSQKSTGQESTPEDDEEELMEGGGKASPPLSMEVDIDGQKFVATPHPSKKLTVILRPRTH